MSNLLIIADLHGYYPVWVELMAVLRPEDGLAIAGDLFDTRYGDWRDSDFMPDQILAELRGLPNPVFYVYGNCDEESFFPGQEHVLDFDYKGLRIHMCHGHRRHHPPAGSDLIVYGHTHRRCLKRANGRCFVNPGSIAMPRDGAAGTYAQTDGLGIVWKNIETGEILDAARLK